MILAESWLNPGSILQGFWYNSARILVGFCQNPGRILAIMGCQQPPAAAKDHKNPQGTARNGEHHQTCELPQTTARNSGTLCITVSNSGNLRELTSKGQQYKKLVNAGNTVENSGCRQRARMATVNHEEQL